MGNQNLQYESILATLLESDEDLSSADTDSELEDHLSEDDVQSDVEEAFVDDERDQESIASSLPPEGNAEQVPPSTASRRRRRKTNRWPMCLFYGMLNIAFVNEYIIYSHNVVTKCDKPLNRRKFMKHLSMALTSP